MKGTTWEGGLRVPLITRLPSVIPRGVINRTPAATVDIFPMLCRLAGVALPDDRVIDGRDLMPMLKDAGAKSAHEAIYAMHGANLATIRSGKWKLHVRAPGPAPYGNLSPERKANWIDPRGPDGVILLAPYEQPGLNQHPGLTSGDRPQAMMLFDLEADRGEQHDVASEHPGIVKDLLAMFEKTRAEVPKLPPAKSAYLFRRPRKGHPRPLMRLIGGALRYDRIPKSQRHLIAPK